MSNHDDVSYYRRFGDVTLDQSCRVKPQQPSRPAAIAEEKSPTVATVNSPSHPHVLEQGFVDPICERPQKQHELLLVLAQQCGLKPTETKNEQDA
jgi:hypothetical protein